MSEELIKAYDIIIENQRNADSKAYIFIAIISAFLTFMNEIPLTFFTESQRATIENVFYITLIPLIALILSLIPKYNNQFKLKLKKKKRMALNIFYWRSMLDFKTDCELIHEYKMKYNKKDVSIVEEDLLSQIHTNANILEYKKQLHNLAFIVLIQFMIIILVSILGIVVFGSDITITFILLLIIETMFILRLLNINIFKIKFRKKNKNKLFKTETEE